MGDEEDDYVDDYSDYGNSSSNDSYHDYSDYHTVCDKEEVRSFARLFLPAVYALVLVVGVAGNALVVAVYASRRRLRTLTDVCLLNLAVADLLLLCTLPFWAADAVHGWRLGVAACKLTSFLYAANFSCGMLLLACISVDRYRALAGRHASARAGPGPRAGRRWLLVCVSVWTTAALLGLPDMALSMVKHGHPRPACMAVYPHSLARPAKAALEVAEVCLSFLLPFLVMVVCYSRVARALVGAVGVREAKRWRALRVLLAVVAVFLATQLPYNVVKLCRALDVIYALVTDCGVSKQLDRAAQVTESLALTHCCVNPVLYAFVGTSLRGHVLRVAKRLGERFGRRRGLGGVEEQAVEMTLNARAPSQSISEDEDTSTFTI